MTWKEIFGPLDEVAAIVVSVLRALDEAQPGAHTQPELKRALALQLRALRPDQSPEANRNHAENMVAHVHREWTEKAGLGDGAKRATLPAPVMSEPPWLRDFTSEWGRRAGKDGKWDLFRRSGGASFADLVKPTADPDDLEARVSVLLMRPFDKPVGEPSPKQVVGARRAAYERRPDVKAWVLREAHGRCESCGRDAPFKRENSTPYLELHHVVQLAEGGPDTVENAVALCPTCHRLLHHGQERKQKQEQLYQQIVRLERSALRHTGDEG